MITLFWICISLLLHSYLIYPISVRVLGKFYGRQRLYSETTEYSVSLLVSAYNEEAVIEDKINNCLQLDYPSENFEIVIGSDGSTDQTATFLNRYSSHPQLKVFNFDQRTGKAAVLNKLYSRSSGEILILSDANTMLSRDAIKKLVSNFADKKVGCVCGHLILRDSIGSSLGIGESTYWRFESKIKEDEGRLGIVIGVNGGIYSLRRCLYESIPENKTIMDDFFITTRVLLNGKETVYEPLAFGEENTSADPMGEFKRKVRISQANFNHLFKHLKLLNPRKALLAYSFFSHKLIRWFGPMLLFIAFVLNILIVFLNLNSNFYIVSGIGQIAFYSLAVTGYYFDTKGQLSQIAFMPFYFLSMNVALLIGMYRALLGGNQVGWERVNRSTEV